MENFDQLFESALQFKTIEAPRNNLHKQVMKSRYQYEFNNWLVEVKKWDAENEAEYLQHLTKENWKEFLTHKTKTANKKKQELKNEEKSWHKTKPPTAPAIALFCNLVNDAEVIKRENQIPEIYCKRICDHYDLNYTDRVRQNFYSNKSKKHYKELIEYILPFTDEATKESIQRYLDKKNPSKQKLYA